LRRDFEHAGIGEDTAFEEFHDVEWGAENRYIFAKDDRFWDGDLLVGCCIWVLVVPVKSTENFKFTLDLVSCP
jgi:hypothetical protein